MTGDNYDIDVKPEVLLMDQVIDPLETGQLRIPRFQRPFVWRPEQILDLFDSIERGYPIGSLLFWETSRSLASLDQVGGLKVPAPSGNRPTSFVLDGHQRLSALYGSLRRPANAPRTSDQHDWMWWPYRVLGEQSERANPYRHWKSADPPPANYLPMRSVLRTIEFLAFARDLAKRATPDMDVDAMVDEAERVAQRVKQYKIAVIRLIGGSLEDCVEVFSRVNSTGMAMRPAQMVSALTYTEDSEQSLADRIEELVEGVAETGFGAVSADAIFQAVLAISGESDVQRTRWEVLAKRVKGNVRVAADLAEAALEKAVVFLREDIGVPLARLIPYDAQLMLLIVFFHDCPNPSEQQRRTLVRWFWLTSWAGHFASATTTQIKTALTEMRGFAGGGTQIDLDFRPPRPFPDRFDLRSARLRALIIWELKAYPVRLTATGNEISAAEILARGATTAYRQVVSGQRIDGVSSPGNRLVFPTERRVSVKAALLGLSGHLRDEVLRSHGIPENALDALRQGDPAQFIEVRRAHLAAQELAFMREMGAGDVRDVVGETDIDTS